MIPNSVEFMLGVMVLGYLVPACCTATGIFKIFYRPCQQSRRAGMAYLAVALVVALLVINIYLIVTVPI